MRARTWKRLAQGSSAVAIAILGAAIVPTDASAGTTDFTSIDIVYATPVTYDHRLGGGAYNGHVVGFTAGSDVTGYQTGDAFACGDYSTFLIAIKVKANPIHANQTIEFDFRLDADSSTESGAGFVDFGTMGVNYGVVQNGKGPGGTDAGMSDDKGSTLKLVSKSFQYASGAAAPGPYVTGSQLVGKFQVSDLEANEQVIVRIDAKIGCKADGVTGGLPALTTSLGNLHGASPVFGTITGSSGSKGANTYYPDLMAGATSPYIWSFQKTVTSPSGSCPGSERIDAFNGAPVKYCYAVVNSGTQPLLNVTLVDDNGTPNNPADDFPVTLAGVVSADGGTLPNDLASGASATGQAVAIADFRGGPLLLNTAKIGGTSAGGTPLYATDTAGVNVSASPAALSIAVKASLDGTCGNADDADPIAVQSGTPVRFCYQVTNTGSVALTGVGVSDPGQSVPGALALAPGQSGYLLSDVVPAVSSFSDNAVASASYGGAPVRSNNDSASVIVPVDQLSIAVTMSLDPTCAGSADLLTVLGGTTVYTCYRVTNGGDTEVSAVTVDDPLAVVPGSARIPPGGSQLFVSEGSAASADITHTASAGGVDFYGFPVESPVDRASVDVVAPALAIHKTVSLDGTCPGSELVHALAGQPVTTCYEVENEGDTAVSGVLVSDAGASVFVGDLPAGRSKTVSSTFDAKVDTDTFAMATGTVDATGTAITSAQDDAALDVIRPALSIATTVSTDGACPGKEIANVLTGTGVTWCYTVTNTGDVPVDGIGIKDDQNGDVPGAAFALAPGQSATLSRPDTALADGVLVAVASGIDAVLGSEVQSDRDPAAVNVVSPTVDIDVTVSLDGTCPGLDSATVPAGVSVTPCYVVTNRGDETLFDLVLRDGNREPPPDGDGTVLPITTIPSIPAGGAVTIAGDAFVVTGDGSTIGTVTGSDVFGFEVSDADNALVDALFAGVSVDKTVSLDGTCPGSEVVYALPGQVVTTCYTVSNTGDLPVTGITVVDGGASTPAGDLPPGGSVTVAVTAPAGDDTNSPAVANGTNGGTGAPVSSPPDAALVDVVHPALAIEKTVSLDGTCPGSELVTTLQNQLVTYCYNVTNAGDTAVGGVVIDDGGTMLRVPNLGAGQSAGTSLTRIVADDESGTAIASATVVATGSAVASPPDGAAADVIHPALSISTTVSTNGSCPGSEHLVVLAGTPITWCYEVTGAGDVGVGGTLASDERGAVAGQGALVAPGEIVTFQRAEQASNDEVVNGVANGHDVSLGSPVTSNVDPADVDVVHPAVTLQVTVSTNGACPGADAVTVPAGTGVVTCYTVTNSGDDTLAGLIVNDADRGQVGTIPSLPPGGSITIVGVSSPAQDDRVVSGTVNGADEHGFPVSSGDTAAIDALFASITIEKTVSTDGSCPGSEAVTAVSGQDVTTCYTVTNTGDLPLDAVIIDDGGASIPVGSLAPGQSFSTQTDAPATDDRDTAAVASGVEPQTGAVVPSQPDGAAVDVIHPALSIEKTASLSGACPGEELVRTLSGHGVTWCYTVTNSGDAAVSNVSIDDAGVVVQMGDLAAGASASASSAFVASADAGSAAAASGTVSATGTPVQSPPDAASVDVIHPALSIATTVSLTGVCPGDEVVNVLPGTSITWCYAVTNTGDVAVNGVGATDNHAGPIPSTGVVLGAGQTVTFTLADTGTSDLTVMASASGVDAVLGTSVTSNQDPAAVNVVHPSVDIDVTVSLDGTCPGADSVTVPAGTVVTTCYAVGNLGDETLTDIIVKDRNGSVIGTIASLPPNEGQTFVSAPGPVVSDTSVPASVSAIDTYGFPVSDADTALIDALFEGLTIQKTASLDGTCPGAETVTTLAGKTVTYCYTVTNSGDIAVNGISVSDDGATVAAGSLAPGQSVTVSGARVVADDASTPAVAQGTSALTNHPVASPPDGAIVDVVHPALAVQKTVSLDGTCPGVESVSTLAGASVTYCYLVTNTGDTTVNAVTLADDGAITPIGNLAPGQSASAEGAIVAARDTNTGATVSGNVPATSTEVVSPPDGASIDVVAPALSVVVTASLDGSCPGVEVVNILTGTNVTWCYTVTNTGDTPVTGVTVTDVAAGLVPGAPASLAPGASATFTRGGAVADDVTTVGFATGTAAAIDAPVTSNQDPAVANVVHPVIDIDVTVSTTGSCPGVDSIAVPVGNQVTVCYAVTNPGDDTLTDVVVRNAQGAAIGTIPVLPAGGTQTLAAASPKILADTTVLGTASGFDLYGFPASDSDSAVVEALVVDLALTKEGPASVIATSGGCGSGGTSITYTITVTNLGTGTAQGAVVTDVLPSSLDFVSAQTTKGSCSHSCGNDKITCTLGNLAPGASAVITVKTTTNGVIGTIVNTASVTSSSVDVNLANNSDSATTQVGTGATRTIGYYSTHPDMITKCLAAKGGMINLGFVKLRNEIADNEIDADTDSRVETGLMLTLGILKAGIPKYSNGVARSALLKARMQAGQQMVGAICNAALTGAVPSFDLDAAIATLAGTNVSAINAVISKADAFNNSKDSVSLGFDGGTSQPKAAYDDPTDPND